jgi:hypothetical protein
LAALSSTLRIRPAISGRDALICQRKVGVYDVATQNRRAAVGAALMNAQNRLPSSPTAVRKIGNGRADTFCEFKRADHNCRALIVNSRLLYR